MSSTTFSGPVTSTAGFVGAITGNVTGNVTGNLTGAVSGTRVTASTGFESGTSGTPIVIASGNENILYGTTAAVSGDIRLLYSKLTFTSTGSGETLRAFTVSTGTNVATGGTINGAHISLSINGTGTVSGAGNALRVTLGGTSTAPGGTIAALQLDSDFATGGVWTHASYIRCTNSNTGTIDKFAELPDAMIAAGVLLASTHVIPIKNASGTPYYIMCNSAPS